MKKVPIYKWLTEKEVCNGVEHCIYGSSLDALAKIIGGKAVRTKVCKKMKFVYDINPDTLSIDSPFGMTNFDIEISKIDFTFEDSDSKVEDLHYTLSEKKTLSLKVIPLKDQNVFELDSKHTGDEITDWMSKMERV